VRIFTLQDEVAPFAPDQLDVLGGLAASDHDGLVGRVCRPSWRPPPGLQTGQSAGELAQKQGPRPPREQESGPIQEQEVPKVSRQKTG